MGDCSISRIGTRIVELLPSTKIFFELGNGSRLIRDERLSGRRSSAVMSYSLSPTAVVDGEREPG